MQGFFSLDFRGVLVQLRGLELVLDGQGGCVCWVCCRFGSTGFWVNWVWERVEKNTIMKTCNCTQNESHNFLDCLPKSVAWCVQNLSSRPRWKVSALWRSTGNYEMCHWCGIKHDVIVGARNWMTSVLLQLKLKMTLCEVVIESMQGLKSSREVFIEGYFAEGISNFVISQKDFS